MNDTLTPLQALVALVAVAETSLDYRPQFRRALTDAHIAIAQPSTNVEPLEGMLKIDIPDEREAVAPVLTFERLERGAA